MSWKAGDKAYCIKKDGWRDALSGEPCEGPAYGTTYLVEDTNQGSVGVFLSLCGLYVPVSATDDRSSTWLESNFRKIVPQCDREEMTQEERITELIEIKYPNLA